MISIVIGVEYSESVPIAKLFGVSMAILLFEFIFERGAVASQIPSVVREHVWYVGPSLFTMLFLMKMLIDGNLFELTFLDLGLFLTIIFGFWMIGAGLKRLLVRGRFEQAYREMITKAGNRTFHLDRKLLFATVVLVVIIDLFAFVFDREGFLRAFSASLIFLISTNLCIPTLSDDSKTQHNITADYNE